MRFTLKSKRSRKRRPASTAELKHQPFEHHGETFLRRLTRAITEESWITRVVSLAWTAGPVTFAALWVAYELVYEKKPPNRLLYYFIAYTAASGFISLGASFLSKVTIKNRREEAEKTLSDVINKLSNLIFTVRNEDLRRLNRHRRKVKTAILLLRDPDATEISLETAMWDLSDNQELASRFARLETYRRKGAVARVQDEAAELRMKFSEELATIRRQSTTAANLVEYRLAGDAPSKKIGQRRSEGFIFRSLDAAETGRFDRWALPDVEELLKLLLELLLDRKFTVFRWKLAGDHPIVDHSNEIDELYHHRSVLKRRWRHLIHGMERHIRERGHTAVPLFSDEGKTGLLEKLAERAVERNEVISDLLIQLPDLRLRQKLHNKFFGLITIQRQFETTEKQIEETRAKVQRLRRPFRNFVKSLLMGAPPEDIELDIQRSEIRLSHERKIKFAMELNEHLKGIKAAPDRTRILTETDTPGEDRTLGLQEIKFLGYRIGRTLEKYVDLTHKFTIDALDASFAINLSPISAGLTRKTRIGWLHVLVDEMEENLYPVAVRTAVRFTRHFRGRLPQEALGQFMDILDINHEDLDDNIALTQHESQMVRPAEDEAPSHSMQTTTRG